MPGGVLMSICMPYMDTALDSSPCSTTLRDSTATSARMSTCRVSAEGSRRGAAVEGRESVLHVATQREGV